MNIDYGIQIAYTARRRRSFWVDWSDQTVGTGIFSIHVAPHPDDARMEFRWSGRSPLAAKTRPACPGCTSFNLTIRFQTNNPRPRPLNIKMHHNCWEWEANGWGITRYDTDVTATLPVPSNLLEWSRLIATRKPLDPAIVIGWWEDQPDPWNLLAVKPTDWIARVCPVPPYIPVSEVRADV